MQGESRVTNSVLRMIGLETRQELDSFSYEALNRSYFNITDVANYEEIMLNHSEFINTLTEDELMTLRSYTGYQFKNINALLRGNWNYDEHGILNDDSRLKYYKLASEINALVSRFPILDIDLVTYRGVDITAFKQYGITNLEDLEYLKGKYMYEDAFTSTSILSEYSYFNKILENGKTCNIEIKYLIPRESSDGALLIGDELSYSKSQYEYLINSGSLLKVVDVSVDISKGQAQLIVLLLPKRLWNLENNREAQTR